MARGTVREFGLNFDLLTRDQIEASVTGNPFIEKNRPIVRLDMAARSDELKAKLDAAPDWDLIICDEAHRMAASYFGGEIKETRRHKLGKLLGTRTRNLLLMSATPHNGKEADFQLFMGLLDADRFEGRFREGVHKADVTDMMRRMTKEELYRFDGTPLFPERRAYTASYALSPVEADLYQAVTTYVREEMIGRIAVETISADQMSASHCKFCNGGSLRHQRLFDAGSGSKNGCGKNDLCDRPAPRR
jgi:hypothetical protein